MGLVKTSGLEWKAALCVWRTSLVSSNLLSILVTHLHISIRYDTLLWNSLSQEVFSDGCVFFGHLMCFCSLLKSSRLQHEQIGYFEINCISNKEQWRNWEREKKLKILEFCFIKCLETGLALWGKTVSFLPILNNGALVKLRMIVVACAALWAILEAFWEK